MFLSIRLFVYLFYASCLEIEKDDKSRFHTFLYAEDIHSSRIRKDIERQKLPVSKDQIKEMLAEYAHIMYQKSEKALVILHDLFEIKDERDEESMKKVFDIIDEHVTDVAEKNLLLKKIEKETPLDLKQKKIEIRKKVVQEIAKKMYPNNSQNEILVVKTLTNLTPEQLYNTARHWGVITACKTTNNDSFTQQRSRRSIGYETSYNTLTVSEKKSLECQNTNCYTMANT
ncbi:uncharacterized protein LOC101236145 [Hydra vulgaris]|uniref:uncharacterized protein LOC101236145 n=1 Tax=Hydra vulgaris TaxID=6087 RepID=UPI001F5EC3FC|nr:uncharacterized protein LOC101236145 [Hydra vulgaris]